MIASKLGLLSSDGIHLNQAGNVLLSSNKPVILKLATFATSKKETFTRLNHFEGNIFECIDEAIRYMGWDRNKTTKHTDVPIERFSKLSERNQQLVVDCIKAILGEANGH